ncbi:tetratricopeptide repeat protein [Desulfovibrio sp. OttesenSCG-928-C14]|nr:tetratricopeptide repeat protein [Desulfovibrio sp. OttesenSCG-928-C14]
MQKTDKISGVFSTQEIQKVGTGTTTRKTIRKSFWFVVELDTQDADGNSQLEVQPLNTNYIPSGPKKIITKDQFLADFSPEPEFYVSTVFPRMRELTKTVARGERHRKNGEYFSAEMEFNNALKVDEENVRANFGLGLTYLERGEGDKAENIFQRLVKLDAAFEPEHKHLFNEFGIQLRKNKMYKDAVTYYSRALELSAQDENLYYNMARALFENKEVVQAVGYLTQALEMNPALEEAAKFLMWLISKGLVPDDKKPEVVMALKKVKEASLAQQQNPAGPAAEAQPDAAAQAPGATAEPAAAAPAGPAAARNA